MSDLTDVARYYVGWEIHVECAGDLLLRSCSQCSWKRGYPYMMTNILRLIIEEHAASCPGRDM